MSVISEKLCELEKKKIIRYKGSGLADIEKVYAAGKMTARERINLLIDPGTFEEIDHWSDTYQYFEFEDEVQIPGDALVAGWGEIDGRPVCIWAQDPSLFDGSMAEVHIAKILRVMEKALNRRVPIIGIYDSEGYRLQSALMAKNYCNYSSMMRYQTISSGVIPQIALVMGPCVGGAALSAPLADFIIMVKETSFLHLNPIPEGMEREEFGGARMHAVKSGTCAVLTKNDADCINKCKELLSYLPQNCQAKTPLVTTQDDPNRAVKEIMEFFPDSSAKAYDMRKIIKMFADDKKYYEIQTDYAPNLTIGFARFNGQSVGIIANNPRYTGGIFDNKSSDKFSRFTRFCDAFNLPLVYFSDSPGFLPSVPEEHGGILRHGCQVIHATSEVTSGKIHIVLRKLYGGAGLAMPGNYCRPDNIWGWPTAERGHMGADASVQVMFKGKIDRAESPEEKARIIKEATEKMNMLVERQGLVAHEEIIDPRQTRALIIKALKAQESLANYWPERKHENINM